jgi:hypothetical protein
MPEQLEVKSSLHQAPAVSTASSPSAQYRYVTLHSRPHE